ncbi:MAG: hypothetical protein SGI73_00910 [Chloroflexota bacterium]|nr:hypothetical protein [Chloroflexota bacterium]
MTQDEQYLQLLLARIDVCRLYKPRFGQGKSATLAEFEQLYGADVFYAWFGLNNPFVYAAHKAAGGITSLYRQIGIGCEALIREIIREQLGLSADQVTWSYTLARQDQTLRTLSLDARIEIAQIADESKRQRMLRWMNEAASLIGMDAKIAGALKGCVFEIRQGYKSKDSKRQNADVANAGTAYAQGYLPIVMMLSNQIDRDVAIRYRAAGWLLLQGIRDPRPVLSTYSFCAQILDYDLARFFQRNAISLKTAVDQVVQILLSPEETDNTVAFVEDDELD